MPLTVVQEFFYFLMLVLLYGSPIWLLSLVVAWRRSQLLQRVWQVVAAVFCLALVVQIAWKLGLSTESARYDDQRDAVAAYLGDPGRSDVVLGVLAGSETHGDLHYRRYRFPSLDGNDDQELEVGLPPEGVTAIGYVRVVNATTAEKVDAPAARLILKPSAVGLNAAVRPAQFFQQYHPDEDPKAFGQHTLILTLRARGSVVVHAPADLSESNWRWVDVSVER